MERSVIDRHTEIHHRMAGEKAPVGSFADSFFNGGNVVAWDCTAKNIVHKFKTAASRKGLDADLAVAELAVSSGLLLVAAMPFGARSNCFAIGNFWSFECDFCVIPAA